MIEPLPPSPLHADAIKKLIRAVLITEDDAEELAAVLHDARRLIPLKMTEKERGILTLSHALLRYLEAPDREPPAKAWLRELKRWSFPLWTHYTDYLTQRRAGHNADETTHRLAAGWMCSQRTVQRIILNAETELVAIVHQLLMDDIARHQSDT